MHGCDVVTETTTISSYILKITTRLIQSFKVLSIWTRHCTRLHIKWINVQFSAYLAPSPRYWNKPCG